MLVQNQPLCSIDFTFRLLLDQSTDGSALSWETRRYRLTDWWDMKPFPVARLLGAVRAYQKALVAEGGNDQSVLDESAPTTDATRLQWTEIFQQEVDQAEQCSLFNTADQYKRIIRKLNEGCSPGEVLELFPELINRLQDECKRHVVLMVAPEYVRYLDYPSFFDPKDPTASLVSANFATAGDDIAEAGQCLAHGRATACVMHLNRVMEVGLKALASAVGVSTKNDWGNYLREINTALQNKLATSGTRTPLEEFYSEARVTFDAVRRVWRNPTMYVDKTYTVERAEEIMISVRTFMRHLATQLHD